MKDHSPAAGRRITHASLLRVLIAGFSLVIVLLLAGAFIGIGNIHTIKENAARLVAEQQSTNRLLEEVHRQQANLTDVFSILARDPDSVDSGKILSQLDEADRNIDRIVAEGAQTPQRRLYDQLRQQFDGLLGRSAAAIGAGGTGDIFLAGPVPRSRGIHLRGRQAHRVQLPPGARGAEPDRHAFREPGEAVGRFSGGVSADGGAVDGADRAPDCSDCCAEWIGRRAS